MVGVPYLPLHIADGVDPVTTTSQQISAGVARVTNPTEYVPPSSLDVILELTEPQNTYFHMCFGAMQ